MTNSTAFLISKCCGFGVGVIDFLFDSLFCRNDNLPLTKVRFSTVFHFSSMIQSLELHLCKLWCTVCLNVYYILSVCMHVCSLIYGLSHFTPDKVYHAYQWSEECILRKEFVDFGIQSSFLKTRSILSKGQHPRDKVKMPRRLFERT